MSYIGKGVEVVTFNTATTLDVAGNITVGGTVDGRDVAIDGTKLDTIAANAIANLSEDTTPQLGGNLDLNTSNVIGTGNINVTGSITGTSFVSTGDMSFTNNSKAIFGTSPSLEIYHDGSNSILDDVGAGNFKMQLAGADKLEITSTGVDVTGTVTADGLTVDTNTLHVDSTNNRVGIGTASPSAKLQVKDGTNINVLIGSLGSTAAVYANNDAGSAYQDLRIDGSSLLLNSYSGGNVGIGTSSIASGGAGTTNLNVHTPSSNTVYFKLSNTGTGNTASDGFDLMADSSGNGYVFNRENANLIFATNNTERMRIEADGSVKIPNQNAINELTFTGTDFTNVFSQSTGGFQIGTSSTGYFALMTNNLERLYINSSGSVGIGTSSPATKAEIYGTAAAQNLALRVTNTAADGYSTIQLGDANAGIYRNGSTQSSYGGASSLNILTVGGHPITLGTSNTVRLTVDPSGSVGIGTTSPAYTLQVGEGNGQMSLGNATSGNGSSRLKFLSSTAQKNWQISTNDNVSGALEFTQTTAGGGTTFAASPAMLIDLNGRLRIGTTAAQVSATEKVSISSGLGIQKTDDYPLGLVRGNSYGQIAAFFNYGGTLVGSIDVAASSTAYVTSSDYRLKENVVADWDATTRLKQLNPVRFNFIADADTTVDGFLAHEVQDVVPEAISGTKDAMRDEKYEVTPAVLDEDGNEVTPAVMGTRSVPDYQGIDQSKLVPLLVKTIQELEARITALETAE
jgi:hypothetical protein